MVYPLRVTLLVLSGLALLLWIGSYALPPLRRQADATRVIVRWLCTLVTLIFITWSFIVNSNGAGWLLLFHALGAAVALVLMWAPNIGAIVAAPLAGIFDGGSEQIKPEPLYSIAEARRRQGRIHEAMWEIHAQLEKFPNDYRGQMLLAEIQAQNANDLAGAEATIHRICSQRKQSPSKIAGALTLLADWHLQIAQDIEAARAAFEEIMRRFPETELAQHAANRIAHLGEVQTLLESRDPRTIQMPPSREGERPREAISVSASDDALAEAQRLADHLTQFPQDSEAREELARLYAERLQRLDLATEQLEQLIALTGESPRHIVHWLNLLADLQIRCTGETELAAATIRRIIERFPGHAFAVAANERLQLLPNEAKGRQKSKSVKLGGGWPVESLKR